MNESRVKDTLLIFRVGPVYCCAPVNPVQSVIVPPNLTQPPGSSRAEPGIFHYHGSVIRVIDLRERFGVAEGDRDAVGRLIITQLNSSRIGYWVDAIGDVLPRPKQGWSELPPQVPREIFTRAFIYQDHITLLTDFERVRRLRSHHLAEHLERIKKDLTSNGEERSSTPIPKKAAPPARQAIPVEEVPAKSTIQPQRPPDSPTVSPVAASSTGALSKAAKDGADIPKKETTPHPPVGREQPTPSAPGNERLARKASSSSAKPSTTTAPGRTDVRPASAPTEQASRKPPVSPQLSTSSATVRSGVSTTFHNDRHKHENSAPHVESRAGGTDYWPLAVAALLLIGVGGWLFWEQSPVFLRPNFDHQVATQKPVTEPLFNATTERKPVELDSAENSAVVRTPGERSEAKRDNDLDSGEMVVHEEIVTSEESTEPQREKHDQEPGEEASSLVVAAVPTTPEPEMATEIVTEIPPPSEGASVTLRKDEEGYVIEIHEPAVSVETVGKENRDVRGKENTDVRDKENRDVRVEENATQTVSSSQAIEVEESVPDGEFDSTSTGDSLDYKDKPVDMAAARLNPEPVQPFMDSPTEDLPQTSADPVVKESKSGDEATSKSAMVNNSVVSRVKPPKKQLLIHIVVKGDTLWHIAIRYLGDPFRYPELARLSHIRNPDLIYPGDKVRIVRFSAN